jgi:Dolichyl-phosphate-mannose-protein mannosyltransferase
MITRIQTRQPFILSITLLLIAGSRILRLHTLAMGTDEVWAIWQTFGTPAQIGSWTPVDWPPVYFLVLGAWRLLVGIHPIVLHFFSLLLYLIGCAFIYRAMRRLAGEWGGVMGLVVYAALGYGIYASTEVRGYSFILALLPLALWTLTRYFARPTLRRAIPLGATLAFMFSVHLSSVVAFAMLGLYSLLAYRRRIWRWWLPGTIAALIASPVILSKVHFMLTHENTVPSLIRKDIPTTIQNVLSYFGNAPGLWLVLFVLAVIILILHRPRRFQPFAMLIAVPIVGLLMYWIMALDNIRYFWWALMGFTVFIAWGLAFLPPKARLLVVTLLCVVMFLPTPNDQYQRYEPNDLALIDNFQYLSSHIRWGDVVVLDPNATYSSREGLDYATRVFFPNGLQYVSDPTGHRRIWYITFDGQQDPKLASAIGTGRIAEEFVGPPLYLMRLYEGPPDAAGILFENGMRFHGADVIRNDDNSLETGPFVRHEGESVKLRMWWSVDHDAAVSLDYSVGVFVLNADGKVISESDSAPQVSNQPTQTSQWTANAFFLDTREMVMPFPGQNGDYTIEMAVYDSQHPQQRIMAPGLNVSNALPIASFTIKAW